MHLQCFTLFWKSRLFGNVFNFERIYVAQGRGGAINWATWISHAELMRLKCVGRQRREKALLTTQTQDRRIHTLVLCTPGRTKPATLTSLME